MKFCSDSALTLFVVDGLSEEHGTDFSVHPLLALQNLIVLKIGGLIEHMTDLRKLPRLCKVRFENCKLDALDTIQLTRSAERLLSLIVENCTHAQNGSAMQNLVNENITTLDEIRNDWIALCRRRSRRIMSL